MASQEGHTRNLQFATNLRRIFGWNIGVKHILGLVSIGSSCAKTPTKHEMFATHACHLPSRFANVHATPHSFPQK